MGADWSFAGQVGGVGFGMVFVLLVIPAVVIQLTGIVVKRTSTDKNENGNTRKGTKDLSRETVEIPIAGKIISVNVKVGDEVKEEDTLCLLESMKMENPILAPVDGTITQIGITAEQVVKPGDIVAVIEY